MSELQLSQSVLKCRPFVCALKSTYKSLRCDYCFQNLPIDQTIRCERCVKMWYCSDTCCINDSIGHSFECDVDYDLIQIITDQFSCLDIRDESDWCKFRDPDEWLTHTLLLLRVLFRMKADPNCTTIDYQLPNGSTVCYDQINAPLCEHMHRVYDEEDMSDKDNNLKIELIDEITYNFGAWLQVVKQILDLNCIQTKLGVITEEVLMRTFRIIIGYTLYVCDSTFLNDIGKALYIEMCFITHSCIPNCCPLFDGSNCLDLRIISEGVTNFSQLRYDYQIEMTGYPALDLFESLIMRNIDCKCIKCCNPQIKELSINYNKNVLNANLKYGNWPPLDYCQSMYEPIEDALESYDKLYGKHHPMITAMLLWKIRIEWFMINCEEDKDITKEDLFSTYYKLRKSMSATHGLDHIWSIKLRSIDKPFQQLMSDPNAINTSSEYYDIIDNTIEQIIPRAVINSKLS
ncbi:SET and MYND domain-containing protein DDB_G0273589-like [Oppia nitens]|uniref:SET and MYND domain-containing protein DDB_G0273589-like n=1 Tax=Oppia nitens TaxID=1686743 RepID=UPI0023DB1033|nr:SET and MYND domain-containing protein DDB_G0273589-like [Oppia nitens]